MLRIIIYVIVFGCVSLNLLAQSKNELTVKQNLEDFDFALQELESSYSGFDVYVNESTRQEYDSLVSNLRYQIELQNRPGYDAALYLYSWFCDGHLGIDMGDYHLSEQYTNNRKKFNRYTIIDQYMPEPLATKATEHTYLIRMPDFDEEIISFEWVENAIQGFQNSTCENLIIDVRGNGGGDERLWHPILPLLYDHSGNIKNVEFRMSERNIEYLELVAPEFPEAQMLLDKYNSFHNQYVPLADGEDILIEIPLYLGKKPKRAAIIIDANCASATEGLLLQIKASSDKALIYGKDNTMGCLDCSSVRETSILPNSKFPLLIPTARTCQMSNMGIDKTGIEPDVIIPINYPKAITDNVDEWTIWISEELEK